MLPLGCLPHWGREGVTLIAAAENKLISGKMISTEPKILFFFFLTLTGIVSRLFFDAVLFLKFVIQVRTRTFMHEDFFIEVRMKETGKW